MGKDLSQREKSEHENDSDSEDEYSNESSGRDDNCAGNADENDVSTSECISTTNIFSIKIIRRQNRTRLAEKMQKNMMSMSLNHNC